MVGPGDGEQGSRKFFFVFGVKSCQGGNKDLAAVNAYFVRYRNLDLFSLVEEQLLDCLQNGEPVERVDGSFYPTMAVCYCLDKSLKDTYHKQEPVLPISKEKPSLLISFIKSRTKIPYPWQLRKR